MDKDLATSEHQKLVNSTKSDPTYFDIYTDVSNIPGPENKGIGVGLTAINCGRTIYIEKFNMGTSQIVYNGELEGVTRAIEYTVEIAQPGYNFRIFSDNQAGLYRLRTPSDNPGQSCQIRAIDAAKTTLAKGANIRLYWSPGHTDIYGNELADFLAKRATKLEPSLDQTSFAVLGLQIKEKRQFEWGQYLNSTKKTTNYRKHFTWNPSPRMALSMDTKRELASSFYQLKLGHGYIKSYLYRFHHLETDKCSYS